MSTASSERLLLTLPDIAALAQVKRPVVSMWRSRSTGTPHPFPEPVMGDDGQELFPLDEMVDWLGATERGNNPDVAAEAAMFAALDRMPSEDRPAVVDGITALLALKVAFGRTFAELSAADVFDLADDADPHDVFLYSEVRALGEHVSAWAAHTDAMASAAYTPAAAMTALMARRTRLALVDHATTSLTLGALDLVAALATELADPAAKVAIADPFGSDDVLVRLRECVVDSQVDLAEATVATAASSTRAARLGRRRLIICGWQVTDGPSREQQISLPPAGLLLAQLPNSSMPHLTAAEIVAAVDEVALAMHDDSAAIVLAPASALTAGLSERDVAMARADVLRTGRVRAILQLPAGLWPARSRQRLAVWVLGPAQPGVSLAQRVVAVADMAAATLDRRTVVDVVADVAAAMSGVDAIRAHAFRFARLVGTSDLVAAPGDLVLGSTPSHRLPGPSPADRAVVVAALTERAALAIDVVPGPGVTTPRTTLDRLMARRAVRVVAGNRLDPADLAAGGGVGVIGPDEVLGTRRIGDRAIDRMTLTAGYPAARYTEPGDVVFCTTPAMGALVDTVGLSVVTYPARILRLDRGAEPGLVPAVVAQSLRSADPRAWRRCPVALVPQGQVVTLDAALSEIDQARLDLDRRRVALDELFTALSDGVTSGTLMFTTDGRKG